MVKKYKWDESVATGEPAIDVQHKQFFAVLYDFAEALDQGNGAKEIKKMLVFLKYYGEWHFGKEEDTFACYKCPLAGENQGAHKKYMVTIDSLLEQIRNSGTSEDLAHSSYEKLTDWLVNHIMKIDMVNADHIKSCKQ
jgi:hemerythrin